MISTISKVSNYCHFSKYIQLLPGISIQLISGANTELAQSEGHRFDSKLGD